MRALPRRHLLAVRAVRRNDRNATDFDAIAVVSSATQSKLRAFNVRGLKPSTRLGKGLVGGIKG